ncbi:trypsin-like peptidase domain-containing protein [Thermoflexus hugenholtzii]
MTRRADPRDLIGGAQVRIYATGGETVVGSGFLLGRREVVTCAHVVTRALGLPDDTPEQPSGQVFLDFPFRAPGQRLAARVARWYPQDDIAFLELESDPPAGVEPVPLAEGGDLWGHPFRAFGFPAGHPEGVWASGVVRGPTAGGWLQVEDTKETGYRVQPGFSGAPVWDDNLGGVVGMVSAAERDPGVKAAFIIPASILKHHMPPALRTPHPAPNPFCDRGRINDPARFFDRERILRELRDLLAHGTSVSLVGEPQIGKSSVLYALYRTGREWFRDGVVHYVDLQGVLSPEDFCAEVLEGLGEPPGDLPALKRALRRKRLVLLLDEVEKLARPAFTADLHDLLRALAQERTLTLAVASHRRLVDVFPPSSDTSPFHNIFVEKRLGPFTPEQARAFIFHRLQGTGVRFTPQEVEQLVVESGGHPARLQERAYALFEAKRGGD